MTTADRGRYLYVCMHTRVPLLHVLINAYITNVNTGEGGEQRQTTSTCSRAFACLQGPLWKAFGLALARLTLPPLARLALPATASASPLSGLPFPLPLPPPLRPLHQLVPQLSCCLPSTLFVDGLLNFCAMPSLTVAWTHISSPFGNSVAANDYWDLHDAVLNPHFVSRSRIRRGFPSRCQRCC